MNSFFQEDALKLIIKSRKAVRCKAYYKLIGAPFPPQQLDSISSKKTLEKVKATTNVMGWTLWLLFFLEMEWMKVVRRLYEVDV